ncbi:eukaryotic translation initiation factor 2 subunit alpha homolog [Olea europaea subsp. europaea]|uniref:Eukaryotic translation initiation factor 2 subunit alpha homolog n=1 Tax=Olea europaea subsp. europaea TaxID=158383 RepID=A0A8S0U200_OLEEU|nr:eukaryotic translation initiation factor 2 subunit alpha homolog [Olea europaea subsp. europaea]
MAQNWDCRMYEEKFPEIDTTVMIKIKSINSDTCAYVWLLEYNMEGMLSFRELSQRRIRSVASLVRVGRVEPVKVIDVDPRKGFVNLSKKRVSEEDRKACEDKYNKSKHVHSIMQYVAETENVDLEDLYIHVGWPLYKKYGHAFEAFKLIVNDPDSVLNPLTREVEEINVDGEKVSKVVPALTDKVKDTLVKIIRKRITSQVLKIRADIDMTCFEFDGVLHIKEAMRKAEAAGTDECPVKIRLIGAPKYVLYAQTVDKAKGIEIVSNAIVACTKEIERHKGKLVVRETPREVREQEDKLSTEEMSQLNLGNEEVESDENSEKEDSEADDTV